MRSRVSHHHVMSALALALIVMVCAPAAYANGTPTVSAIAQNMVESSHRLPGLISGLAYILALLFGALGILKLKEHVESPQNTPIREGMIRLLAGGALLALPTIYTAMRNAISPRDYPNMVMTDQITGAIDIGSADGSGFNAILSNIAASMTDVPGLLSAAAYLLALIMGVGAILKFKEHVESPQNTPIREGVIRLLIGGALFALPAIFYVMKNAIAKNNTGGDVFERVATFISGLVGGGLGECNPQSMEQIAMGGGSSGLTAFGSINIGGIISIGASIDLGGGSSPSGGSGGGGNTLGDAICSVYSQTSVLPFFLSAAAYLFGIVLGIWGLMKLKDHVLNPQQNSVWDAVARFVAAGAFFALPYVIEVMTRTVSDGMGSYGDGNFGGVAGGAGLDAMMVAFVSNIYGPMTFILNWFGYVAGAVLIMIGISRLLKSAQEGPRGPGGLGTIMTFITGGALLSLSPMIGAFSGTLFYGDSDVATTAQFGQLLGYGFAGGGEQQIYAVISAVLQFMIILGIISFVRGIFILRDVAEGSQQASMLAGITHLLGGALAVNLGPVMNAVQSTLGLTGYGIIFT